MKTEIAGFIEAIRLYPELYDKSNKFYKDNRRKNVIWDQLAKDYGFEDGKAAIARWKGIRDQFRKKKPSGDSADESGGYVYGPLLNFLLPHVADRPSFSSASPIVDYKAAPKSADIDCNFLRLKFTELVKMMETTQELIKETQKEDDADLYGKTVANFLRKFGPRKQLQIRMEIDQLMMENLPED